MKKLQKGFSLVELLVVVAIIGVLAGVGIVGYQSYTDSAKSRVGIANFNSVKRFTETELTLLNNNIQTVSGALSAAATASSCTTGLSPFTIYSSDMEDFVRGLTCYFATDGYGNAFKNPFDAGGGHQVVFSGAPASMKKGNINVRFFAGANQTTNGAEVPVSSLVAAGGSSGYFLIEYYTADGAAGAGSTGEYKAKAFQLK
ncbi:pilin [Candidatus Pelagibacter sp.]|uniref:pilin n=1 Tax=Candidatus Pelagibacter sp. TaxID=2024849 RepID=UPI003F87927C